MYVLRSEEHLKQLEALRMKLVAEQKSTEFMKHLPAGPGDVMVDRDLKKVYLVDKDGAMRRCDDPAAKSAAIEVIKKMLEVLKKK